VDDLQKLDLYGDLTAMPKGTDSDQDQGSEIPVPSESNALGKEISKKELGRLRSKQAVLAKLQASAGGATDMPGDEGDEPQTKKTRSEIGNDGNEGNDVVMIGAQS
jgi:tRNA (guanine-N(7)-)-methyltransferase subunit TRM82